MSIALLNLPRDTRAALGPDGKDCQSRSLWIDRFAQPMAKKGDRESYFKRAVSLAAESALAVAWHNFLKTGLRLPTEQVFFAQLQSRLMVNMAGGVMENAGLSLDRFSGLPVIPGSAVKGCARRAVLAALREWCETSQKPGAEVSDQDNLFKAASEPFTTPAEMLAAPARAFGWCELDWKSDRDKEGRLKSDFA